MSYDDTNRIVLFKNNRRREGEQDAQLTGKLNVEGKEYYVDVWTRSKIGKLLIDKNGERFLSGSIKPKDGESNQPSDNAEEEQPPLGDDDFPF